MQAVLIRETGDADVLIVEEVPEPLPGPDDALVEIAAAGVNYIDTYHRRGLYPRDLPFVPGIEAAGTVVEVGSDMTALKVGDRVAWPNVPGSYADRVLVTADDVAPVPKEVPLETAAAAMLQGATAHYLVTDTYALGPGSSCLVHAGAGGVGLLLIQMAKMLGATVFTTVSTSDKAALAKGAGADHVFNYVEQDFVDAVMSITAGEGVDVVYDGVGQATFMGGLDVLRTRGTMALFGQASGPVPPIDLQVLNQKGSLFVTRPTLFHHIADPAERDRRYEDLFSWIRSGSLDIRIGQRYPLAEAATAHRDLEERRTTGKSLLIP